MCTCKCCIDELTCVAPIGGSITQHKSLIKATERKAHSIYYANPDKPFEKTRPQNHKVKILILSHAFIFFLCSFNDISFCVERLASKAWRHTNCTISQTCFSYYGNERGEKALTTASSPSKPLGPLSCRKERWGQYFRGIF